VAEEYPVEPIYVCEFCFGPLEAVYDYTRIKKVLSKRTIEKRPKNVAGLSLHPQGV